MGARIRAVSVCLGLTLALAAADGSAQTSADRCADDLSSACLTVLGAGSTASVAPDCAGQLAAYRACLEAVAGSAPEPVTPSSGDCSEAVSRDLWAAATADDGCSGYEAYLAACPATPQAAFARLRLEQPACAGAAATPATPKKTVVATPPTPVARDGCRALPTTAPMALRAGDVLCDTADPTRRIVVKRVGRGRLAYENGPYGEMACAPGDRCGVYWRSDWRFEVGPGDAADVVMMVPR